MKKTIIPVLAILILSLSFASASWNSFLGYEEAWSFQEDIYGEDRGFTLTYNSDFPKANSDCDYYDWTYDGRKCRKSKTYTNSYDDFYARNEARYRYDADKALDKAFRTFSEDSQKQLEVWGKKVEAKYNRKYSGRSYNYYW